MKLFEQYISGHVKGCIGCEAPFQKQGAASVSCLSNCNQFIVSRQLHLGGIESQLLAKEAVLVVHGVLDTILVTDPLLAALPGNFDQPGLGQPKLGRDSSWGHRGMQPTAPSIHVH